MFAVKNGVEQLLNEPERWVKGQKVGLVTHLYPEKLTWNAHFDRLAGTDQVRRQISEGGEIEELTNSWNADEALFESLRVRYLLY